MHAHPSSRSAGRPVGISMAIAAGSALLPGLAHWVAGRRRTALGIGALAVVLLIGIGVLAATTSRVELLRLAVRPGWLAMVIGVSLAVALAWVVLVTGSYRVLGPVRSTGVAQVGVVLTLAVLSLLVAAPPVAVARYAYLQRDLITDLFPDDPNGGLAAGEGGQSDPFAGRDRVTILLLASDAGPDRTGVRTDSIVAASIDTHTGDVVLLSLPRNLQQVPMPPGPLREQWPNGFPELLNGVYEYVTEQPRPARRRPGPRRRGGQAGGVVHARHPDRLLRDGRPGRLRQVRQRAGRGHRDGDRAAADRRAARRRHPGAAGRLHRARHPAAQGRQGALVCAVPARLHRLRPDAPAALPDRRDGPAGRAAERAQALPGAGVGDEEAGPDRHPALGAARPHHARRPDAQQRLDPEHRLRAAGDLHRQPQLRPHPDAGEGRAGQAGRPAPKPSATASPSASPKPAPATPRPGSSPTPRAGSTPVDVEASCGLG